MTGVEVTQSAVRGHRTDTAALLDALFANSPEAIVTVDTAGHIGYATAGVELLLGHDATGIVGRSVFDFVHPDDREALITLFERRFGYHGTDLGRVARIRQASGLWLPMVVTAIVLPTTDVGGLAITIKANDPELEIERSLRQRVSIGEYCNGLGADLLGLNDPDEVTARITTALAEMGLLTGADVVDLLVEHRDGDRVERFARWAAPEHRVGSDEPCTVPLPADGTAREHLFTREVISDDPVLMRELAVVDFTHMERPRSMLSAPLLGGVQRGALRFMQMHDAPDWSDADAELARTGAGIVARALRTARLERLLDLIYHDGPLGFSVRTLDGRLIDCNRQYLQLLGVNRLVVAERRLSSFATDEHRVHLAEQLELLERGEIDRMRVDSEFVRADGTHFWARTHTVPLRVPGSSERLLLTSVEDVTETHTQRLELEHAARHDPLTGVANRHELSATIDRFTAELGEPPALLVIDLDRFKMVNDSFGHVVGDEVLRVVAARIATKVRSGDVVARLGGDEFAVVAPGLHQIGAERLAERVLRACSEVIEFDGCRIEQRTSVGLALGTGVADPAEMLVRADRALYAAKERGRNTWVMFDDSLHDEVLHRLELERDLRTAIDRGELVVHFQPEFSTRDRSLLGMEALLRWEHPLHGRVPADEFITVAEQSGLISEIGRFSLAAACRDFVRMADELGDPELVLRVNISAREFARPELPDVVQAALWLSGLDPHRLCLEMTETTLMDAPEVALETFAVLKQIGVQSAIDDFGTGYSSLSYLKRFPVDCVKIDRTFVEDVVADTDTRAIVESILRLADAMGLEVVAEGVEREDQLDVLVGLGCERAQGFLVSAALPPDELVELMRSR